MARKRRAVSKRRRRRNPLTRAETAAILRRARFDASQARSWKKHGRAIEAAFSAGAGHARSEVAFKYGGHGQRPGVYFRGRLVKSYLNPRKRRRSRRRR